MGLSRKGGEKIHDAIYTSYFLLEIYSHNQLGINTSVDTVHFITKSCTVKRRSIAKIVSFFFTKT